MKKQIWILMFLLSFSFLSLLPISVKAVPTITYNAGTDTILVNGYSQGSPADFEAVYQADITGGWGQVSKQGTNQFLFDCKLQIGNGGTTTYFNDTDKQVTFSDASASGGYEWVLLVYFNAYMTLGNLLNATTKTTSNGVSLRVNITATEIYMPYIYGSGYGYFYSCVFQGLGATHLFRIYASTNVRIYQSEFDNMYLWQQAGGSSDIYRTNFRKGTYGLLLYNSIVGTYDDILIHDATNYPIYFVSISNGGRISNLKIRNTPTYETFRIHSLTDNINLTDADFDEWAIYWTGTSTGKLYRQYTFKINITNTEGVPIENANVTLTDIDGIKEFTVLTGSNGSFNEKIVTYGFYNQTGGNTPYMKTPHILTITHSSYDTLNYTVTINEWKTVTQVVLTTNGETTDNLIVFLAIGLSIGICLVVAGVKLKR